MAEAPGSLKDLHIADMRDLWSANTQTQDVVKQIVGFGTVAAYAEGLGMAEQAHKLKSMVSDIYKADEYASRLAEAAQRAAVQG